MKEELQRVIVDDLANHLRIDRFLSQRFPEKSRAYLQRLILSGNILCNFKKTRKSMRLNTGDILQITWKEEKINLLPDATVNFSILYEDESILVINKPSNLIVHPGAGIREGTLVHGLLHYDFSSFSVMEDPPFRPGIVHRLDRDTTGVMVIAKNVKSREFMIQEFKTRKVKKSYLAIVHGGMATEHGTIASWIGRNPRSRKKMAVVPREKGKEAISDYNVLFSNECYSLVKIFPKTGRTHQIRVHLSSIGHAIIGDILYGKKKEKSGFQRPMLHAWTLGFSHPLQNKNCCFTAPIPNDFSESVLQLFDQRLDELK